MPDFTTAELEVVYDELAQAIDRVGPEQTALFLTKLALLSAQKLGNMQIFVDLIEKASQDL